MSVQHEASTNATASPSVLAPDFDGIPAELTAVKQWVLWRLDPPKKEGSDWRKVPYCITGKKAESNDPGTWTVFQAAKKMYGYQIERKREPGDSWPPYSGVGYVLSRERLDVGIDLDDVRNPETGEVLPKAQALLDVIGTYAEVSPSGTGFKIFARGTLPDNARCSYADYFGPGTKLEMFDHGRYFTVTGAHVAGTPKAVNDIQPALEKLVADALQHQKKIEASRPKPPPRTYAIGNRDPFTVSQDERIRRARKYLATIAGAISGNDGHNQTFKAARHAVWGFDLDPDSAFAVLSEWNLKCQPEWSEKELWHKIEDARNKPSTQPCGWHLLKRLARTVSPKFSADWKPKLTSVAAGANGSPVGGRSEHVEAVDDDGTAYDPNEWADEEPNEEPIGQSYTFTENDLEAEPEGAGGSEAPAADESANGGDGGGEPQPPEPEDQDDDPILSGKRKAVETEIEPVPLGERCPQTGKIVLSLRHIFPTVDAIRKAYFRHEHGWTICSQGGFFFAWRGNRWEQMEDAEVERYISRFLNEAVRYERDRETGCLVPVHFESTVAMTRNVSRFLLTEGFVSLKQQAPAWINGGCGPDPRTLLAFPSGTLDVTTGHVSDPTPLLFNFAAIDFEYDPNAKPPELWHDFLRELWGGDLESIQLLQEFFGYCLTGDTSQQKALFIIGPRRSGKGTIARVLEHLVGKLNICAPSTSSLAGPHGTAELVGKSLAMVSDARFHGPQVAVAVENLLRIIGEDTVSINPKNKPMFSLKLATRFLFLANELPRFADSSSALVGRFLIMKLVNSFYGKEDPLLTEKLLKELPGILLWAIEGLKRLRQRGHFVQPQSGTGTIKDFEDLANPVGAFIREHCEIGSGDEFRVEVDTLYEQYKLWCGQEGQEHFLTKTVFGRRLAEAEPTIDRRRNGTYFYSGIRLARQMF